MKDSAVVVEIHCPACGRWLGDVLRYGRVVCRDCGCEIIYRSAEERRRDAPRGIVSLETT